MSHQYIARLEYTQECRGILEDAVGRLSQIEEDCESLESTSSDVLDESLRKRLEGIVSQCGEERERLNRELSRLSGEVRYEEIRATHEKTQAVNSLELQADRLSEAVLEALHQKMAAGIRAGGHQDLDKVLSGIKEPEVASLARILAKNRAHDSLSSEELVEMARSILDPSRKVSRKQAQKTVSRMKKAMEEEHVAAEKIEEITGGDGPVSPLDVVNGATGEIVGERVRRSAVKAITRSIADKGFIVDRKNIRIDRAANTVHITALKPGGQRAEFSIAIDGRFVYRFDGYQGQACMKDITPFEEDLEKVYGIRIKDKKDVWSNPDKLTKSHYAEMDVRRDS